MTNEQIAAMAAWTLEDFQEDPLAAIEQVRVLASAYQDLQKERDAAACRESRESEASGMSMFPSPFVNDPFGAIWVAFKNLYPEKNCTCYWTPQKEDLISQDGTQAYGVTDFDSDTGAVTVLVGAVGLDVNQATEIFAHELAHVAVGIPEPGEPEHGERWEEAFEAIFKEYNRMMSKIFGEDTAVDAPDGKEEQYEHQRDD